MTDRSLVDVGGVIKTIQRMDDDDAFLSGPPIGGCSANWKRLRPPSMPVMRLARSRALDHGATMFVELGFELPLDRLEATLRRLEQFAPDNPWILYYLAWVWSTRRRHTLALVTIRRAGQLFRARWEESTETGHPVHRDQAMEALWPEGDPERGSKNLNVALTATRRGLEQVHPDGSKCLRRQGSFYRIAPEMIEWLDVGEFLDLSAEATASAAAGDLEAGERAALRALQLAGEDYLASEPYTDLGGAGANPAKRARRRPLDPLGRVAARPRADRSGSGPARAALTRQPLRERAWLVVMKAYLARGDRVAALNAYDECARRFTEQLGVDPSAELRNLATFLRR